MDNDLDSTDDNVVYVPTSASTHEFTYTHLGNFTVDGETFAVFRRDDDGSNHYDWIGVSISEFVRNAALSLIEDELDLVAWEDA